MGQGIVVRREVPQAGMTFYRLTEQEPQTKIITHFRDWYWRWQAQLRDAGQILDLNGHDRRR